jgi:hypothetical protein
VGPWGQQWRTRYFYCGEIFGVAIKFGLADIVTKYVQTKIHFPWQQTKMRRYYFYKCNKTLLLRPLLTDRRISSSNWTSSVIIRYKGAPQQLLNNDTNIFWKISQKSGAKCRNVDGAFDISVVARRDLVPINLETPIFFENR